MIANADNNQPWLLPISLETMENAIKIARWLSEHAKVAFGLMGERADVAIASDILNFVLRDRKPRYSRRDLHQQFKGKYSTDEVQYGASVLCDRGHLRHVSVALRQEGKGGRPPTELYDVNPILFEEDSPRLPPPGAEESFEGFEYFERGFEGTKTSVEHGNSIPPITIRSSRSPDITVTNQSGRREGIVELVPPTDQTAENESSPSTDSDAASTQAFFNSPYPAQNPQNTQNGRSLKIIVDKDEAKRAVARLAAVQVVGFDIETTGLDPILDKIRLVQVSSPDGTYVFDIYRLPLEVLRPLVEGGPIKVIHNAKFDCSFFYSSQGRMMPSPVYDTMLADQVIKERGYARSLRDLADEYLGVELPKDEQVSDWSQETLTRSQIEYAARDAAVLLPLHDKIQDGAKQAGLERVIELENSTVPFIVWTQLSGVGFDPESWSALVDGAEVAATEIGRQLDAQLTESVAAVDMPGQRPQQINWDSPAQVLQALKSLGLGIGDTQQQTLERVRDAHPLIPLLLEYRERQKKVGTYGTKWLQHIHPATERIHADWKQIGAATGRMSCTAPNMQNLPRDPRYRSCFVPAEGKVFVKADYSQIELRIAAEIANDESMIKAFKEGVDLHRLTASHVTGKPVEEVTDEDRQLAKAVNFGLIYGMGAKALAEYSRGFGVALTEGEARKIREAYFRAYPGIRRWHTAQGRQVSTRTVAGRRRTFERDKFFTAKLNSPVQGTGADGLKLALARMWETRDEVDAYPVLIIHDEIVVETPAEQADATRDWLQRCMVEGMSQLVTEVPVVVDADIKQQW